MSRLQSYFGRRLPVPTVALAGLTLAGWLGRWHWGADLAAQFVPHYAVAALLLCLGLSCLRRPAWAGVAAVVLCAQLILLLPYYLAPSGILGPRATASCWET